MARKLKREKKRKRKMVTDINKWAVIFCPKRGLTAHNKRLWQCVDQTLQHQGITHDIVMSEETEGVGRLARMMVNNGYGTLLIVGGDSALNDTINCLMCLTREERRKIAIGVVPHGVVNDFARFWHLNKPDTETLVKRLATRHIRQTDIGCICYTTRVGTRKTHYFLNCINIGLVASIIQMRRKIRHLFLSRTMARLLSFPLFLFQRIDHRMTLRINNEDICQRLTSVCIGNGTNYGLTPNAVPYNGQLDVSIISHPRMLQLIHGYHLLFRGQLLNHNCISPFRTQQLEFDDIDHALVSTDGRVLSEQPIGSFKISVLKEEINFLV